MLWRLSSLTSESDKTAIHELQNVEMNGGFDLAVPKRNGLALMRILFDS